MSNPESDQKKELHAEIMKLWQQYRSLSTELLVTEGRVADLRENLNKTGQKIYKLYRISSAGLDGEQPTQSSIDNNQ